MKKKKTSLPTSPVPVNNPIKMMDFFDALREVLNKKKVTKVSWDNNKSYIFIQGDFLCLHRDDKVYTLIISIGDLEGRDWFVLPE